jgi:acetyl-CoA acetyltransferase
MEGFSRTDVDTYAAESQDRAAKAIANGAFARSVVPVLDINGQVVLDHDEFPRAGTTVEALGSLKLTPAPVGTAQISKAGVASFPITGGNVTYYTPGTESPYVQGMIKHAGSGLSLTGGGKTVELTDFDVDPGKSVLTGKVTVDGEVAAEDAPLFFLDGRTLKPLETGANDTAILEGTTVKLKQEAADLLNQTFGVDALAGGFVIGVAKITVNTAA